MKRSFITGLIILLPLTVTIWIANFLLYLLTDPFMQITKSFLTFYTEIPAIYLKISSQLIILVSMFSLTLILGVLAKIYIFDALVIKMHALFNRIPLINKIYKSSHEVVKTILSPPSTSFMQVVLVPFPQPHLRSFGFITNSNENKELSLKEPLVSVFVPATPNPTQGFVILFPHHEVTYLDITAEEALKIVVSAGLICSEIREKKNTIANELVSIH